MMYMKKKKQKNPESQDRRNSEGVRALFVTNFHSCYNFARLLHENAIINLRLIVLQFKLITNQAHISPDPPHTSA